MFSLTVSLAFKGRRLTSAEVQRLWFCRALTTLASTDMVGLTMIRAGKRAFDRPQIIVGSGSLRKMNKFKASEYYMCVTSFFYFVVVPPLQRT